MQVRDVWGLLVRNRWVILAGAVLATSLAVAYLMVATPVYEAGATLRVDEKQANLPGIYRALPGQPGEFATEIEVLKSRTQAVDAIDSLGLQLRVTQPRKVSRSDLFQSVKVDRAAVPGTYVLANGGADGWSLLRKSDGAVLGSSAPGEALTAGGITLTPTSEALRYRTMEVLVDGFEETVAKVVKKIDVTQPSRDALIVSVKYQDADRQLVWQVPTVIVHRFIERRQQGEKSEARSTVSFLHQQIDTLAVQLSRSEDELRRFREREHVVDPNMEASSQVTRYVSLQAERSSVEAERGALAKLIDEVRNNSSATRGTFDQPSPYRRLLAFPTLLRNQGATDLLRSLSIVEDQRATLLARRTAEDPDVQVLSARVAQIEEQLRLTVTTYLQGLTNQIGGLDTTLSHYSQDLARVPYRQLEFERLQRQPKILTDMYALLQTRLKEAEIAQASVDRSVRIVDEAVAPLLPIKPRKALTVLAALFGGLLLGTAAAFLREFMDRSVHTRADVRVATGLPVLGLIPRIQVSGKAAVIAKRVSRRQIKTEASKPLPQPPSRETNAFTFLRSAGEAATQASAPEPSVPRVPSVREAAPLVTIEGLGSAVTEAYGSLQTNILYSRGDDTLRTLVFTSALPGDGKTTNATNLALTLAQRSVNVILVDADMRRGILHQLLDVRREPGLTDVLAGRCFLDDALHEVRVKEGGSLHFLTCGRVPLNPIALLESPAMGELLLRLRNHFDAIIIDAPPVNMLTDAAVLGANADGVIVVARAGVTQSGALEYAMQQLHLVKARVLGVVLNDIDFKREAAYDAAYRYYQYGSYTARAES